MAHDAQNETATRYAPLLQAMHRDLHALCQPLTALQCRLELGLMLGEAESLRGAVEDSLEESRRMFAAVARMRASLRAESGEPADETELQSKE